MHFCVLVVRLSKTLVVCESDHVSETVIFKGNGVLGISKAQIFLASQGRRLKAGAAKAPQGRRGQDFSVPHKTAPLYGERPQNPLEVS